MPPVWSAVMPWPPMIETPFFQRRFASSASRGIGRFQIQVQLSAKSAAACARSSHFFSPVESCRLRNASRLNIPASLSVMFGLSLAPPMNSPRTPQFAQTYSAARSADSRYFGSPVSSDIRMSSGTGQ